MTSTFTIQIKSGYKTHKIKVQHVPVDDRVEHFKLLGRNKTIVLECNRPFFRNKGLKHRRPDWKLIEGKIDHQTSLDPVKDAILEYLEPKAKK